MIVTLATDFGLSDSYVAEMKGVILAISPDATIIDVSHDIAARSIEEALYITQTAWRAFPAGAVHVCVVDPGVGTARRALVIETARGLFVGPDNGVLSSALPDESRPDPERDALEGKVERGTKTGPARVPLREGIRAFAITNAKYIQEPVSATFHGRDVFAPAAAHLALGVDASDLGEPVNELLACPPLRASRSGDGTLRARVIHIDHFGNVITNARAEDLPPAFTATLRGRRSMSGPARTYDDAPGGASQSRPGLAAIIGSGGYLELALPNGRAAEELGARLGDDVQIRPEG